MRKLLTSEQENQSRHNDNSTADSKKARENSSQYTRQKELKDHHIFSQVVPLSSLVIIRDIKMITDKWMKTQKKTGLEEKKGGALVKARCRSLGASIPF